MAVVAASTTGDTYSGILLGIPGANSAAATMVDGYPLAKQGKATMALTAAVTNKTNTGQTQHNKCPKFWNTKIHNKLYIPW